MHECEYIVPDPLAMISHHRPVGYQQHLENITILVIFSISVIIFIKKVLIHCTLRVVILCYAL